MRLYAGTQHEPIPATTAAIVTAARTASDPQGLRTIHERIARAHGLKLDLLALA